MKGSATAPVLSQQGGLEQPAFPQGLLHSVDQQLLAPSARVPDGRFVTYEDLFSNNFSSLTSRGDPLASYCSTLADVEAARIPRGPESGCRRERVKSDIEKETGIELTERATYASR